MAKGKIIRSVTITFKEGIGVSVELFGSWTRHDTDIAFGALRRQLVKQLTEIKASNKEKEKQNEQTAS